MGAVAYAGGGGGGGQGDRGLQAARKGRRAGQTRRQAARQPRGRPVRARGGAPIRWSGDACQGGLGMKDPMKMLRQVQQMQDRMAKVQTELESETVEPSPGAAPGRAAPPGPPT